MMKIIAFVVSVTDDDGEMLVVLVLAFLYNSGRYIVFNVDKCKR
jgi:hypothetical protein